MQNESRPKAAFVERKPVYFFTASAAAEAEESALIAAELAAIAEDSAAEAAMFAAPVSAAGGVTMTVAGAVGAGVTTVSSFLLQAANEIAATIETNRSAFFILVSSFQKGPNNYW